MGYCKHEWQARSEQLREVFSDGEGAVHEFFVCRRCLRIREVEATGRPRPAEPADEAGHAA